MHIMIPSILAPKAARGPKAALGPPRACGLGRRHEAEPLNFVPRYFLAPTLNHLSICDGADDGDEKAGNHDNKDDNDAVADLSHDRDIRRTIGAWGVWDI